MLYTHNSIFPCSASNLVENERPPSSNNKALLQKTMRLEKSLEDSKKEYSSLQAKVSQKECKKKCCQRELEQAKMRYS